MLSCNELYHILGLENPDKYAEDRFKSVVYDQTIKTAISPDELPNFSRRASGRSTKTYIELISYLSMYPTEKVYYMSPSILTCKAQINNIRTLIDKVNKIKNINLDYKNIIPCTNKDQLNGICPTKIFYDHYYFEYINV